MSTKNNKKTPKWKADFPIHKTEAAHVSRREFAKFLGLLSGALAVGNGAIVIKALAFPEKELEGEHFVCNAGEVPVGEMLQFYIEGRKAAPYILIHLSEKEWRAYEQKCTHLACAVRYRRDLGKIECPCHKGYFDPNNGNVLAGPPPRPLPQLEVINRDGKLYVRTMKEQNPDT